MSRVVIKREEARRDLVEQFEYLAERSLEVANRFLLAANATFNSLARGSALGERFISSNPAMQGIHRWQVDRFPNHLIFYRPLDNGVEIIRVLHAARDWQTILHDRASS